MANHADLHELTKHVDLGEGSNDPYLIAEYFGR
jgi:hypothetical protein